MVKVKNTPICSNSNFKNFCIWKVFADTHRTNFHVGFVANKNLDEAELIKEVLKFEAAGFSRKEAIAEVAKVTAVAKRDVFNAMVEHKSYEGKV